MKLAHIGYFIALITPYFLHTADQKNFIDLSDKTTKMWVNVCVLIPFETNSHPTQIVKIPINEGTTFGEVNKQIEKIFKTESRLIFNGKQFQSNSTALLSTSDIDLNNANDQYDASAVLKKIRNLFTQLKKRELTGQSIKNRQIRQ